MYRQWTLSQKLRASSFAFTLLSPHPLLRYDARTTATRNEHHLQHLFPTTYTVITPTMALRSAAATIAKRVALAAAPQVR